MISDLKSIISKLPKTPGVYIFKNAAEEILYIGKAVSLRDRVRSYTSLKLGEERGRQFEEMVNRVKDVEIMETGFEVEALLLEAKLIRREKPFYNIRLRDDKSFAVIVIDRTSDFPQITTAREVDIERICSKLKRERSQSISQKIANVEYFGPYPSAGSAKHALQTLRRAFKFRDCSPEKFRHYQKIGRGCLFHSIHLCDAPCIGAISKEDYNCSINNIREFLRGNRSKVIRDLEAEMKQKTKSEEFERAAALRDQIFALTKIQTQAHINIETTRRVVYPEKKSEVRSKKSAQDLRIEAFDISNISGEFAVGAMVVGFLNNPGKNIEDRRENMVRGQIKSKIIFAKQFYRRFKIRTVEGANDIAMMQEVLMRRFRHLDNQSVDWARPNLVFIDGGRGHLNAAVEMTRRVISTDNQIPIIAVAKGSTRKKVDLYYNKNTKIPVELSELPKIAEIMREEAHRFAIGYYRTLHRNQLVGKGARK